MRLIQWIEKLSIGRNVVIFWITQLLLQFVILFGTGRQIERMSGEEILDLRFNYSFEEVIQFFEKIGETGLKLYMYNQIIDMFFLFFYAMGYSLLIMYLITKVVHGDHWLKYLALLPFALAGTDIVENIGFFIMMGTYPNLSIEWIQFVNSVSMLKHMLTIACLGVLVFIIGLVVKKRIRHE